MGTLQLSRNAHQGTALVELEAAERDQAAVQVLERAARPGEQEARAASRAWDSGPRGRQGWRTKLPALTDLPERSSLKAPVPSPGQEGNQSQLECRGFV